jgi:hypothetical protein
MFFFFFFFFLKNKYIDKQLKTQLFRNICSSFLILGIFRQNMCAATVGLDKASPSYIIIVSFQKWSGFKITIELVINHYWILIKIVVLKATSFLKEHKSDTLATSKITLETMLRGQMFWKRNEEQLLLWTILEGIETKYKQEIHDQSIFLTSTNKRNDFYPKSEMT